MIQLAFPTESAAKIVTSVMILINSRNWRTWFQKCCRCCWFCKYESTLNGNNINVYYCHSDYECVGDKQRNYALRDAKLIKQRELNKTIVKFLNRQTLLDKQPKAFQVKCMVASSKDSTSRTGTSSSAVPMVISEGYEKLDRTTMGSRPFGSGSLVVEHRSDGDVNLSKQCVKLTGSFDSLMDTRKHRNEKSMRHAYEKLNKYTMQTVETYSYAQPHSYLTLTDDEISGSAAGSPSLTTHGCDVDPLKHQIRVYEKLNKATMEATMACGDSKPQSIKHPGSGYEQLNRATMQPNQYSYEPLNRETMEPTQPADASKVQIKKRGCPCEETIGSTAGSPTMATDGCNTDSRKPLVEEDEKLNKATMEVTTALEDSNSQSVKDPGSSYEQLDRATMESKPVSDVPEI